MSAHPRAPATVQEGIEDLLGMEDEPEPSKGLHRVLSHMDHALGSTAGKWATRAFYILAGVSVGPYVLGTLLSVPLKVSLDRAPYRLEASAELGVEHSNSPREAHALLINSYDEDSFNQRIDIAYFALRRIGLSDQNIHVLHANASPAYVDAHATLDNTNLAIQSIAESMQENDMVFVYDTGHSVGKYLVWGDQLVRLEDQLMHYRSFSDLLAPLDEGIVIGIYDTCLGYDSAKETSKYGVSVSANGKGLGAIDGDFERGIGFGVTFLSALSGLDYQGKPVDVDKNHDGKSSFLEVVVASGENDPSTSRYFTACTPHLFYSVDPDAVIVRDFVVDPLFSDPKEHWKNTQKEYRESE